MANLKTSFSPHPNVTGSNSPNYIGDALTFVAKGAVSRKMNTALRVNTKGNITNISQLSTPKGATNSLVDYTFANIPGAGGKNAIYTNPIKQAIKSTIYNTIMGKSSTKSSLFRRGTQVISSMNYGYSGDVSRDELDTNQLIVISLESPTENYTVTGKLQKEFNLNLTSEWESFLPPMTEFENFSKKVVLATGFMGDKKAMSLLNPMTSRRIWKGTAPLSITVDLHFMCVTEGNAQNEVVRPCLKLQNLILPTYATGEGSKLFGIIPIMLPPGPNPLSFDYDGRGGFNAGGDQVTVEIGGTIKLRPVIVKSVNVTYDNKLDKKGLPLSSKASITFETFQIITKNELLTAHGQSNGDIALSVKPMKVQDAALMAKSASIPAASNLTFRG